MDSVVSRLGGWYGVVATATGVAVTVVVVWKLRRLCRRHERVDIYPADTVIVHQFGRCFYAPNIIPSSIKLETYLRMAKVPYQNHFTMEMSSKGESPWITYNGQDIADSQFCIEFVNKKFEVDLNTSLSERDQAVALAFRKLIEDNFNWCGLLWRWVYDSDWTDLRKAVPAVNYLTLLLVGCRLKQRAVSQGMGRHSREEVMSIAEEDLRALSAFLGKKEFFMGDIATEIDACVFGTLVQVKWQMQRSPCEKLVKNELVNLSVYCDTMKRLYWPDWDDCVRDGGAKKETA